MMAKADFLQVLNFLVFGLFIIFSSIFSFHALD